MFCQPKTWFIKDGQKLVHQYSLDGWNKLGSPETIDVYKKSEHSLIDKLFSCVKDKFFCSWSHMFNLVLGSECSHEPGKCHVKDWRVTFASFPTGAWLAGPQGLETDIEGARTQHFGTLRGRPLPAGRVLLRSESRRTLSLLWPVNS